MVPIFEKLFAVETGKTDQMNNPVYPRQAILDLSKMLMYEFCYDYMLPKYRSKVNLCYMDTGSLEYEVVLGEFYKDIAKGVETKFSTST